MSGTHGPKAIEGSGPGAPGTAPRLSDRGSMIWPLPWAAMGPYADAAERLALGRIALTRKAEIHATIFNYGLGKHLAKVCAARPSLAAAIDAAAATWPWALVPGDVLFHLVQTAPGKEPLGTIVVLVDAPIAGFYEKVHGLVAASGDQAEPAAAAGLAGLAAPLPPHVTLYTTDPTGKAGIGLNSAAELDLAVARAGFREGAQAELAPALRAYRLHPDVVRPSSS